MFVLLLNIISCYYCDLVQMRSVLCMINMHLGEAIDGRVCETLEEIFRRVRFRSIDLEATSLDEEVSCSSFHIHETLYWHPVVVSHNCF